MRRQQLFAIPVCAVLLAGLCVGEAVAGEVKGPRGTEDNTNYTGARENANSNCAYSGLNDLDSEDGQNQSLVQTVADAWKYYGFEHGFPGWGGACHGGTNENRVKGN